MRRRLHSSLVAAGILAGGMLVTAQDGRVKPPIRGLVSMGAFKFVGSPKTLAITDEVAGGVAQPQSNPVVSGRVPA